MVQRSFCFWLYFTVMPKPVMDLLEEDAKEILWASNPELCSNEEGTTKKSNRWIREMASYNPRRKGGAGVMHWPSHCAAFYAQRIIRYMHPRKSPWKTILRSWIRNDFIEDATILENCLNNNRTNIPKTQKHIKA